MKGILITSDNCPPCDNLKKEFADLLATGEIVEKKFEDNPEEVADLINKYGVDIPSFLVVSDSGELVVAVKT